MFFIDTMLNWTQPLGMNGRKSNCTNIRTTTIHGKSVRYNINTSCPLVEALHVGGPALWCDVFLHVVFALHVPVHGVALSARVLAEPAAHGLLVGVQHGVHLEVLQLPEHLSNNKTNSVTPRIRSFNI